MRRLDGFDSVDKAYVRDTCKTFGGIRVSLEGFQALRSENKVVVQGGDFKKTTMTRTTFVEKKAEVDKFSACVDSVEVEKVVPSSGLNMQLKRVQDDALHDNL